MLLDVDNNPIINGGTSQIQNTHSNTAVPSVAPQALPQAHLSVMDFTSTIFVYIALFFAAYWFFIRPQKKRQEKLVEFQNNLKPGDNIITTAGLHGKIIEVEEKTFIIEFGVNKSVRIPVSKNHILSMEEETQQ